MKVYVLFDYDSRYDDAPRIKAVVSSQDQANHWDEGWGQYHETFKLDDITEAYSLKRAATTTKGNQP